MSTTTLWVLLALMSIVAIEGGGADPDGDDPIDWDSRVSFSDAKYTQRDDSVQVFITAPFPDGTWSVDNSDVNSWRFIPFISILPDRVKEVDHLDDLTTGDSLFLSPGELVQPPYPRGWDNTYSRLVANAQPQRGFDELASRAAREFEFKFGDPQHTLTPPINTTSHDSVVKAVRFIQKLHRGITRSFVRYDISVSSQDAWRKRVYPDDSLWDPLNPRAFRLSWVAIFGRTSRTDSPQSVMVSREFNFAGCASTPTSETDCPWKPSARKIATAVLRSPDESFPGPAAPQTVAGYAYEHQTITYVVRSALSRFDYSFGVAMKDLTICRGSIKTFQSLKPGESCANNLKFQHFDVLKDHTLTPQCARIGCMLAGRYPKTGKADVDSHNQRFEALRDSWKEDRPFVRAGDAITLDLSKMISEKGPFANAKKGDLYFIESSVVLSSSFSADPAWLAIFNPRISPTERRLMESDTVTITATDNSVVTVNQGVTAVAFAVVPAGCTDPLFDQNGDLVQCSGSSSSALAPYWFWWVFGIVALGVVGLMAVVIWWLCPCDGSGGENGEGGYSAGRTSREIGGATTYRFSSTPIKEDS